MQESNLDREGQLQASKWLKHIAFLDVAEMEALLSCLPSFKIFNVSEMVRIEDAEISREQFMLKYIDYVTSIKAGLIPPESETRPFFSAAFSTVDNVFFAIKAPNSRYVIKPRKPIIQLRGHFFTFSKENRTFHSGLHSKEAITWGLQFSFPQIYSNSIKNEVVEVYKDKNYTNTQLFKELAVWMRRQTLPTPFMYKNKRINAQFRLGKKCINWINTHAQLAHTGLTI